MKRLLLSISLLIGFGVNLFSQISGIINTYTPVTEFNCDTSVLDVGGTTGFFEDDLVLIIQMQGATVSLANDSTFGSILNLGSTGNFTFNRVESVGNGQIRLRFHLSRSFDLAGSVQLVRVPEFTDVTATDLSCKPWDGTTGGVLALDVSGTLTMAGNFDVSNRGFRGGKHMDSNAAGDNEIQYSYPVNPDLSAEKAEGIAIIPVSHSYGRGKSANGGGGGNAHNGGGGGGKLVLTAPHPTLTSIISGGANGIANQNMANDAQPGKIGNIVIETGFAPYDTIPNIVEENIRWRILNIQGQQLMSNATNAGPGLLRIDLPEILPNGLYFFELLRAGGEKETLRFVLQR